MRARIAGIAAVGIVAGLLVAPASAQGVSADPGRLDGAASVAAGVREEVGRSKGKLAPLRKDASGRVVVYVDGTDSRVLRKAVAAVGGQVSDASSRRVRAAVPPAQLAKLAATPGVTEVRRPETPVPMAITSEGVQPSYANLWHDSGRKGAGAKVGILDVGFARLAETQANAELPANVAVSNGNCGAEHGSSHGTTVAEAVHDMAPDAQLFLACVTDSMDFDDAARWLQQQGVHVANVSMGFPGTGRGSGLADLTAAEWTPADVVAWLRGQGVLVVAAAGNEADKHFSSLTGDADGNGWVNISGAAESQGFSIAAGETVTVELRWDAWPTTNHDLDLFVSKAPTTPTGINDPNVENRYSIRPQRNTTGGLSPLELVTFTNTETVAQAYWIYLRRIGSSATNLRYDLTIHGAAHGVTYLNAAGSIAEPATSPYALAVGAITPAAAAANGAPETYSSRGPTIDGRVKPDLIGFTRVSSHTGGLAPNARAGTSIAAAHVTGAAALVKGTNPAMDPATIEATLLDSAKPQERSNTLGYGVLNVGQARDPQPQTGSGYTPLTKAYRVLDSTDGTGGKTGKFVNGQQFTLRISTPSLPADTTAVVLNLTASEATAPTRVDVYATAPTELGTLHVVPGKPATTMAIATYDPIDREVKIRGQGGDTHLAADLLGYFSPEHGASTYTPAAQPIRLQRSTPVIGEGEIVTQPVRGVGGIPEQVTAVLVTMQISESTETTLVRLYGAEPSPTAVTAYRHAPVTYTYLAPVGSDGNIRFRNSTGTIHLAADVVGWFATGGGGARYVPLQYPTLLADTTTGAGALKAPVAPGASLDHPVTSARRIPSNAVAANVALSGPAATSRTRWTVSVAGGRWSGAPSLSTEAIRAGRPEPPWAAPANAVVTPLAGALRIRNYAAAADVQATVLGYFVGGASAPAPAAPTPNGHWRFDEGSGTTAADSSGGNHPATLRTGSSWTTGLAGGAASVNGTTGHVSTSGPVLNTADSFTVAAWVKPAARSGVVLSQDGTTSSAFSLEYASADDRWSMSRRQQDTATASVDRAAGPAPVRPKVWTHLAGVYDADLHELRLYVNGELNAVAEDFSGWASSGLLVIGAGKSGGTRSGYFAGAIDDVRTYGSALTDTQLRDLYGSYGTVDTTAYRGASLNGDAAAEMVGVNTKGDGDTHAWPNNGTFPSSLPWATQVRIASGLGLGRVRLADLNGDGYSELIDINSNGDIRAWLNNGKFPAWPWVGPYTISTMPSGQTVGGVHFTDLSGDGRAEMVQIGSDGVARAWSNTRKFPDVFCCSITQIGTGWDPSQRRFADLDGDGRAELISFDVSADGKITARQNRGVTGSPWGEAVFIGSGFSDPAWGRAADLDGDGRADLIKVNALGDGKAIAWRNNGNFPDPLWEPNVPAGTGMTEGVRYFYG